MACTAVKKGNECENVMNKQKKKTQKHKKHKKITPSHMTHLDTHHACPEIKTPTVSCSINSHQPATIPALHLSLVRSHDQSPSTNNTAPQNAYFGQKNSMEQKKKEEKKKKKVKILYIYRSHLV